MKQRRSQAAGQRSRIECLRTHYPRSDDEGGHPSLAVRKDHMLPTQHRSLLHRFTARAGLMAVLVLAVVALSRCQMVGDRLTGVSVSSARNAAAACIVECQKTANQALRVESVLHVANVKACGDDPACFAAEAQRHRDAVQGIQEQRRECVGGCHHQGGGSAGH